MNYLLIFLLCTLMAPFAQAQDVTPTVFIKQNKTIQVSFFLDGHPTPLPTRITDQLTSVPSWADVDTALIHAFILSGDYNGVQITGHSEAPDKDILRVEAQAARLLRDIQIPGIDPGEVLAYTRTLTNKVGQVFDPWELAKDGKKLEAALMRAGYRQAKLNTFFSEPLSDGGVRETFGISLGVPCRLGQVLINQENSLSNALNFVTLPFETGSLCNLDTILNSLAQMQGKYLDNGYLSSLVKMQPLVYSANQEQAQLSLQIRPGPQTKIEVIDVDNSFIDFDFLNHNLNTGISYADLLSFSDSDLNDIMSRFYQHQGYPFVTVQGPFRSKTSGVILYKFIVNKKKLVTLKKVDIQGALPFSQLEALSVMGINNLFTTEYTQENANAYTTQLQNTLVERGYLHALVTQDDPVFSADKTEASLSYHVQLGKLFMIHAVSVTGYFEPLPKMGLKAGEPLQAKLVLQEQSRLQNFLINKGYLYAKVTFYDTEISEGSSLFASSIQKINLVFRVSPGPLVHLGHVFVEGDTLNKALTIAAISGLKPNEVYAQEKLNWARLQILRHELFSAVVVEPFDQRELIREDAVIDVVIKVSARHGTSVVLSPGYGTLHGYLFDTDFAWNGLSNDGLRLLANAGVSQEMQQDSFSNADTNQLLGQHLSLGLSEPLFRVGHFYTPLDLSTVVGYQVVAETLSNEQYQTWQNTLSWKTDFFHMNWVFSTALIHAWSHSTSSESAIVDTLDTPSLQLQEWFNTISLDTTNNHAWPTSGGRYFAYYGVADNRLGSDVSYDRYGGSGSVFYPIWGKFSGALLFGGGFISTVTNKDGSTVAPPESRRYTLTDNSNGDALVRGFPESYGSAAPGPLLWMSHSSGSYCGPQLSTTGGTHMMYLKHESRYRATETVGFVWFVDSGASYFSPSELSAINSQIQNQIATGFTSSACVVDHAVLLNPTQNTNNHSQLWTQYQNQAYVSTGLGLRLILGDVATLSLDYGYPLRDPSAGQSNCESPGQAESSSTTPTCITRTPATQLFWPFKSVEYKGSVHLGVDAHF